MKKKFLVTTGAVLMLSMSACSNGNSNQDYESMSQEAETLKAENESLVSKQASQEKNYEYLNSQYESLSDEYNAYRESMTEYEGLAAAEAQARQIQAEALAASKAADEEAAAAAAAAQQEAEAKAGYDTGITYDQLARTPDDFKNKKVKFSGKVLQVMEGKDDTNQIRLAVNNDYDKVLYCEYSKSLVPSRVLEDDKITIYGTSYGLFSYTSTMGGVITIPSVVIDKIDQ